MDAALEMVSTMQVIADVRGSATGMYHDEGYGGVHIGSMTGWNHEATIVVHLPLANGYSMHDPVALAHAFLLSHLVAPGKT